MPHLVISRSARVALALAAGLLFAALAVWLHVDGEMGAPIVFLFSGLSLAAFVHVWRGAQRAHIVMLGSFGLYLGWNVALSLDCGVVGFGGRSSPPAWVARSQSPLVFWSLVGFNATLAALFLWWAVQAWKAG